MLLFAVQSFLAVATVILFNDELKYVCAWGRWRIGPALNEPITCAEVHALAPAPVTVKQAPSVARRRSRRARLRLVAPGPCAPEATT
jgi:hypothetical protein